MWQLYSSDVSTFSFSIVGEKAVHIPFLNVQLSVKIKYNSSYTDLQFTEFSSVHAV